MESLHVRSNLLLSMVQIVNRDQACAALAADEPWDLLVIGGGATGLGVALDAQTRGLRTLLVEQGDFASGTSSKSTKLIHGGVRYLRQGHIGLVRQSLRERAILLRNAPDLVAPQSFLVPGESFWEGSVHRAGLWIYDLLERFSGDETLGSSDDPKRSVRRLPRARSVSARELEQRIPNLIPDRFSGAIRYFDAQFDDAGLALRLAEVFVASGGTAINYARVERLLHGTGRIRGAVIRDLETDRELEVRARCVVNASGVFADTIRRMDEPGTPPLLALSRGSHLVLDLGFLNGEGGESPDALLIPRTADGRVLFAIPWLGRLLVGTTDVWVDHLEREPHPTESEIGFLLEQLGGYLRRAPAISDIRSMFAGVRPLLRQPRAGTATKRIPREHVIEVSSTGLVTIAGGKWTTYRLMAEQTVDRVIEVGDFDAKPCCTRALPLHAEADHGRHLAQHRDLSRTARPSYSSDRSVPSVGEDSSNSMQVDAAMVRHAVRHQMARTVEDVLARRSRWLLLDARKALELAEPVSQWMATELGRDPGWVDAQVASFRRVAASSLPPR